MLKESTVLLQRSVIGQYIHSCHVPLKTKSMGSFNILENAHLLSCGEREKIDANLMFSEDGVKILLA